MQEMNEFQKTFQNQLRTDLTTEQVETQGEETMTEDRKESISKKAQDPSLCETCGEPATRHMAAFRKWLDNDGGASLVAEVEGARIDVCEIWKALSECDTLLPAAYCDILEVPTGSTYSDAVGAVIERGRDLVNKRPEDLSNKELLWAYAACSDT